ncbi:hypothetical protein IMZ48_28355, partial [Candidatus Bathyarchaeota archaeon]|nr:hypothetical protein [Candidatus Bathyarchaeota archaeon]
MASADKSRQSSSRNFFSRGKKQEKHYAASDEGRHPGHDYYDSSAGSRVSHHQRNSSTYSIDGRADTPDSLNAPPVPPPHMGAVPYESVRTDGRPTPVDYLPNSEQSRRDPMPYQLNSYDYHQYPSFDPAVMPNPAPSHSVARGLPHHPAVNVAMASATRPSTSHSQQQQQQQQQWIGAGAGRSSLANNTMTSTQNPRYDSYMTGGRSSGDNASVFSGNGAAYNSKSPRSSKLGLPSASSQSSYASHQSSRETNRLTKFPPGGSSHDGFHFPRPDDDRVVEQMFVQLMQKRGWTNLPDQARRQMSAYPPDKKWTLLHQDRLTEWQGEQKRRQTARPNQYANVDITTYSDEEGTPEWYVRRLMEDKMDQKSMGSLEVNLRTQQIGWVKRFIECQGQVALTTLLLKLYRKSTGPASPEPTRADKVLDREYDIAKCIKAVMNNKFGADDALAHPQI